MKRNVIYATAVALLMNAVAFAQETPTVTQTKTAEVPQNYRPKSAELLPMPAALSQDAIFPAIGVYELTDKTGTASHVTVTQDEENKGIVWIEGLPQGKIKAYLKQSPSLYKIPAQEPYKEVVADEQEEAVAAPKAKKQKEAAPKTNMLPEGTLYYDKENNIMQIQLGTKFNEADPLQVFNNATDEANASSDVAEEGTAKKSKTAKAKTQKAPVVKTWLYTGAKATTEEAVEVVPTTVVE